MTKASGGTKAPRSTKGDTGQAPGRTGKGPIIGGIVIVLLAIGGLYWIFDSQNKPDPTSASESTNMSAASGYKHAVGEPGPGEAAPDFTLASSKGGTLSLSDLRGETVLLYFQGGLMCQPCFDQLTDLEDNNDALREAGIDRIISISHDPVDLLARKGSDMGLSTPLLSDPDMEAIRAYDANSYGMMGGSAAGHSFVLVDPEGTITWRADYGGAPDYTMFLPTEAMLTDLEAERTS